MPSIDTKLFKKYDIRGTALGHNPPLNAAAAHQIGLAFATYLQQGQAQRQVVVGRDNRLSSPDLQAALQDGLRAAGCSVIDLGMVSTPVVYWHAVKRGDIGGVMVTGSHLAPDQNGFKLCIGGRTLYGDQIQDILTIIEQDSFIHGEGDLIVDEASHSSYVNDLRGRIPTSRSLKVVIDAGNGTGGLFGPPLIEQWGHNILAGLYLEPDGTYPNHHPDPQNAKNMVDLGAKVRELHADIGIAFDGDADRMGIVDENGALIAADRVLALLAGAMLKRHPGAVVVADVLSSQVLFDAVENAGGRALMAASGHSLVKEAMRENGALLGGEMSGHIFLGEDYYGFDDGYFAAGRILQLLATSDQSLSALNAELPTLYSTPEYRPHCPDEDKQTVIEGVASQLAGKGQVNTVDGFRIKFARGWGLLRASNTEPVLSLRFEGETEADALAYRDLFIAALKTYPQVDALI